MIKRKDFFKTYHRLSKSIGTTLRKDVLLNLIVAGAVDTMQVKAACLFLANLQTQLISGLEIEINGLGIS